MDGGMHQPTRSWLASIYVMMTHWSDNVVSMYWCSDWLLKDLSLDFWHRRLAPSGTSCTSPEQTAQFLQPNSPLYDLLLHPCKAMSAEPAPSCCCFPRVQRKGKRDQTCEACISPAGSESAFSRLPARAFLLLWSSMSPAVSRPADMLAAVTPSK